MYPCAASPDVTDGFGGDAVLRSYKFAAHHASPFETLSRSRCWPEFVDVDSVFCSQLLSFGAWMFEAANRISVNNGICISTHIRAIARIAW